MAWATFSDEHLRAIVELIQNQSSERVTAIVGGALLDDTLRRTLAERLRDDKDIANKLLKVNGALGNAGPKIDLLYMLKAFDKPVRNALYGISEARNFFAHNLDASFDSGKEKMLQAMDKLVLHVGRATYPHHLFQRDTRHALSPVKNNRDKFIVNLQLCLIFLMRDRVSHVIHSFEPRTEEQIRETIKKEKERQEASNATSQGKPSSPKTPPRQK
jgi:hypothetical protein